MVICIVRSILPGILSQDQATLYAGESEHVLFTYYTGLILIKQFFPESSGIKKIPM